MLLSNESYRQDLSTALNTINNININEVEPIDTTAIKITVRINQQTIQATLDSGAAMSIISNQLARKLNLIVRPTTPTQVQALNSTTAICEVIEDAPIQIGDVKISITLRVVKSNKVTLLLDMDWYKKYQVILDTSK